MTYDDNFKINPEFEHLFKFKSEKAELKHNARTLMFRFLSEAERLSDEGVLQKKDYAAALNTSKSWITQLFNGDKIVSLITLAKLQKAFKIKFKVIAYHESDVNFYNSEDMVKHVFFIDNGLKPSRSSSAEFGSGLTEVETTVSSKAHIYS